MKYSYFFDYKTAEKICLIYTLKCNASCGHCITKSNISRNEKIDFETAKNIIKAAPRYNKKVIIFSGGEAMLFFDEIIELSKFASSYGIDVMIETNGYWALNSTVTQNKLELLKTNGLKTIFVSYDYFHSKYIPYENIKSIVRACNDLDIKCEIMFTNSTYPKEDEAILSSFKKEKLPYYEDDLLPFGNACDMFLGVDKKSIKQLNNCDSFATTFLPNGDVFACCNINDENQELKKTPMYLGNLHQDNIERVFSKEKGSKFFSIISDKSLIERFSDFVWEKGLYSDNLDKQFFSTCDLCMFLSSNSKCLDLVHEFYS